MTGRRAGLHVGVDARSLLCRHPRGEGKTLLQLYRHIVQARPDWRITLFGDERSLQADPTTLLPPGIAVRHLWLPGTRFDSWENVCLPWLAVRSGCDVLHCASSAGPTWSPLPLLLTVHDLIPLVADDGVDAAFRHTFLRRLRNAARQARRIVTVSEHTRRDLLRVLPGTRAPIDVIHWGATALPPAAGVAPAAGQAPYVIGFGGEALRKNSAYLIDRFVAVARRLPALELVLLGVDGERERAAVMSRLDAAGLAGRLRLPGFVGEGELDALLRGAALLLYPSLYEGFGMPVLEAIERGVPVVASNTSSIPEILHDVPGCFDLAEPRGIEDAIVTLLTDASQRSRWVARQAGVLSHFDWRRTAERTAAQLLAAAGTWRA